MQIQTQAYFNILHPHLEGPTAIYALENRIVSISSEDIIYHQSNQQQSHIEFNNDGEIYTSIVFAPQSQDSYFGTESGKVLQIKNLEMQTAQLLYKGNASIRDMCFSSKGFIVVASGGQFGVVIELQTKRFIKVQHSGGLVSGVCCYLQYVCSFGSDGCVKVFKISYDNQVKSLTSIQLGKFKICLKKQIMQSISYRGSFLGQQQKILLALPGSTTLQQIEIKGDELQFSYIRNILEEEEIRIVEWINKQYLVLSTKYLTSIWNHKNTQIVIKLQIFFTNIISIPQSFIGINGSGKLFKWNRQDLTVSYQINQQAHELQDIQKQVQKVNININNNNNNKKLKKKKEQIPIAQKIISQYPQFVLEKGYDEYLNNRFLFINGIGAVIERQEKEHQFIQLQFHNKSKIRRVKFHSVNKIYIHFDISVESFIYSSGNHLFFENQRQIKEGFKWDIKWKGIQAVSLSSDWLAVAGKDQIRIFDFSSNLMSVIPNGRIFMAMATYQDLLVIVYHIGVPMWRCQQLAMKIFRIQNTSVKFIRQTYVEITFNSLLKWFGFSQEGVIFSQDDSECVRMYCWNTDEWVSVLNINPSKERIFIQNIHKYVLNGFRIQNQEGQPIQPTVMPRTLPRRINLEGLEDKSCNFSKKINEQYSKLKLQRLIMMHEQFRYKNWFKYKYVRGKNNPYYNLSSSIMSGKQLSDRIQQFEKSLTKLLIEHLKSDEYLNCENTRTQLINTQYLLTSLAFTDQCRNNIKTIINKQGKSQQKQQFIFQFVKSQPKHKTNIYQIDRLQFMMDRKWYIPQQIL